MIKGKAGMGNRLLSVATGLLYGRITGRKVFVDWSDETYSNRNENAFGAFFHVNDIHSEVPDFSGKRIAPAIWDGHLDESASVRVESVTPGQHGSDSLRQYSVDIRNTNYAEDVLIFCRYTHGMKTLRRHFADAFSRLKKHSNANILSGLFSEFICTDIIQTKVDTFANQNFHAPTIGIHIRHMDRSCGLQPFLKRVEALRKRIPQSTVFLATDDAELNTIFQNRFGACMTDKWYPRSGNSLHQNNECPDRTENGIEALVDMYLLAKCDYLIYPGSSTFSWVASLLSTNPSAVFMDIEQYNPKARIKRWIRDWLYT